jgi:hypothetical protein
VTRRWPYPADRPVDRARQVAQQYRAALARTNPDACAAIDQAARWAGETWVLPQIAQHKPDDLITAPEAAELTGRSLRWVYQWVSDDRDTRMHQRDGKTHVRVRDIQHAAARHIDERDRAHAHSDQE